ncbi:MAG: neutral zinc metallopeptidase [Acidimicrobiia bacterium]
MTARSRRLPALVAVLVVAVVATATTVATRARVAAAATKPAYETTLRLAIDDIQQYWSETLPAVYGKRYVPIPNSEVIAYTSRTKVPQCGKERATYSEMIGNAFYCPAGKFVAYDAEDLLPRLANDYGDFTIAMVFAHEWGHAIQDQVGLTGPTIALEQQADCFAGAWVRHLADGGSSTLSLNEGNLDTGLAGFLSLRDSPGSSAADADAHGSAFDRVGAFQEGYDGGATRCADFETNAPPITEITFATSSEARSGGNEPLREVVPDVVDDLDKYWSSLLSDYETVAISPFGTTRPKCGTTRLPASQDIAFCPRSNTIFVDRRLLPDVYERSGDFGVGALIAAEWAVAMQDHEGVTGEEKALELQQSCFTGSWTGSLARGEHGTVLTLSPGDLDEVIQSYLIFTDDQKVAEGTGASAFENVDAFRVGFFQGESPCLDYAPQS